MGYSLAESFEWNQVGSLNENATDRGRFLIIVVMVAGIPSALWAHGTVGQRKFIEPLFTEDANIKDELHLPRAEFFMLPDGSSRSFSASFEKSSLSKPLVGRDRTVARLPSCCRINHRRVR